MKHWITLTNDDGVVMGRWCIEDEIGDLRKPVPQIDLCDAILEELGLERED